MADIDKYRKLVRNMMQQYAKARSVSEEVEAQMISDTEHDHYQLVNIGWHNNRRIYGCVLHIDIRGGKVWIQHNGTEIEIADELAASGIPKKDIVLGFHSPYKRQFTEFATG